ncbi:MAG TPA: hypothetical protein VG186_16970, partial [Solirubrobacteraceae bacterium]|nr:hypothetical protein [Solirubrobacteraceae bacterium]
VSLVHLIRAGDAVEQFAAFVATLRRCPPGGRWELVLALKGFASEAETATYVALAGDFDPEAVLLPDEGFDLGTYLAVAARLRRDRYCFVNSYAEPLVADWLAKLDAALSAPSVGLVGATGSWNSHHSLMLHTLGLPTPYRGALPAPRIARAQVAALTPPSAPADRSVRGRLKAQLLTVAAYPVNVASYPPFPNPHIRTNGFMISHATLSRLRLPVIGTKSGAYRFESGRRNLTRQVLGLGLGALVVDRDGAAYAPERWAESHTLWQGDQERAMMADNQTRSYADGSGDRRRLLSGLAWGPSAEPGGTR